MPLRSRVTRGKTRPGRLARLDAYLCLRERALLERSDRLFAGAWFVDVGFGQSLATTLESAKTLRRAGLVGPVLGVEMDPARVELARREAGGAVVVRQGGFDIPFAKHERARLVRAMNVLRQYREHDSSEAHARMAARLLPGGLLVEGTSSKDGSMLTAHLIRRTAGGIEREGLLVSTTFARGFAPIQMRDYLPRDLRRRVVAGEPIAAFFDAWTSAWESARADGFRDPKEAFAESCRRLATVLHGVDTAAELVDDGYLLWRPAQGVPAARDLPAACVPCPDVLDAAPGDSKAETKRP